MSLRLNEIAPDFKATTTQGQISFHEWIGDGWAVLFSHPKDFTPVCTTELGYMAKLAPEFTKRNCKIIGLSVDPVENHAKWALDILETQGFAPNYPMIGGSDIVLSFDGYESYNNFYCEKILFIEIACDVAEVKREFSNAI